MDVLFGQAYYLRFDPKLWAAQQPYAPLGALYAAALAREHGHRVALFDAMVARSEREWSDELDHHKPQVAVIYEDHFNYLSKMCLLRMREAALTMIDAAVSRGITTIVSGADASDHPAVYLERGARLVIAGEGEETLVESLDRLAASPDASLTGVAGTCTMTGDGLVARAPARPFIRDLDSMPRPAWDLIDVERYRRIWMRRHGYFSMNVATTRGCPYHCNWCAKPIYGQRYAARSPESVAAEIAWMKAVYRPDHLWIVDDIFGLKPGWIERFAAAVSAQDAVVPFRCLLRADQVTVEIASALRAAACQTAWIGAESGSQRILDAMEKGTRVEQIESATTLLRQHGIEVAFFLQFGYPGETREDIELTLEMLRRCRPDDIGVSVSYPLPGTPFFDRVKAQLGTKQNWIDSDDLAVMYRATYSPEFYRALHAVVHAEFRAYKAAATFRTLARSPVRTAPQAIVAAMRVLRNRLSAVRFQMRVDRLARVSPSGAAPIRLAVLSPDAAAVPSEQLQ